MCTWVRFARLHLIPSFKSYGNNEKKISDQLEISMIGKELCHILELQWILVITQTRPLEST